MKYLLLLIPFSAFGQFTVCDNEITTIQLNAVGQGSDFAWYVDSGHLIESGSQALVQVSEGGQYNVTVAFNYDGCSYSIDSKFAVDTCPRWSIWIPNAVSPNGTNREWFPIGENIKVESITIYDRWGHIAWAGNVPFVGVALSGMELDGVFTYVLHFRELVNNSLQEKTGSVVVVR